LEAAAATTLKVVCIGSCNREKVVCIGGGSCNREKVECIGGGSCNREKVECIGAPVCHFQSSTSTGQKLVLSYCHGVCVGKGPQERKCKAKTHTSSMQQKCIGGSKVVCMKCTKKGDVNVSGATNNTCNRLVDSLDRTFSFSVSDMDEFKEAPFNPFGSCKIWSSIKEINGDTPNVKQGARLLRM
jgi:hypothetical protein